MLHGLKYTLCLLDAATPGVDSMTADQNRMLWRRSLELGLESMCQSLRVLRVIQYRDHDACLLGADAWQCFEHFIAVERQGRRVAQISGQRHGTDRMYMQHRIYVGILMIDRGVQRGLGERRSVLQRAALEIDQHQVGGTEAPLMTSGEGDGHAVAIHSGGIIARCRLRQTARGETPPNRDDLLDG